MLQLIHHKGDVMIHSKTFLCFLLLVFILPGPLFAGDLNPSESPNSTMRTLSDIYTQNELIKNNVGSLANELYLSNCAGAPVPKTGQFQMFADRYDDGHLQRGKSWPVPRFTDNNDGTVTDNLTGLIWLKNAFHFSEAKTWSEALALCNDLSENGTTLTDGSAAGSWRLPNLTELGSLICIAYINPCIPDTGGTSQWSEVRGPFNQIQSSSYWSSTTKAGSDQNAWSINLGNGQEVYNAKTLTRNIWPVRN